ncbi:MAG: protein TolQ [Alphaproteobacteria bacterium]|nr:MAG: protein TolQ [Alphaproteobacteria bacterium]
MESSVIDGGMALAAGDFSLWSLFQRADMVVKAVMIGLLVASIWSWAIIIDKWMKVGSLSRKADKFEDVFWSGKSLEDLYQNLGHKPAHPMAVVFVSAMRELKRSMEKKESSSQLLNVRDRIDKVMNVTINREMAQSERNLGFLATVGSTAPFVGLFGTVWGIMNSFTSIAASQDTSLAVVAPGIAEALFATALGLLAAIPAVIFYNKFTGDLNRYSGRLEGFAQEFSAILSRQLDERGM